MKISELKILIVIFATSIIMLTACGNESANINPVSDEDTISGQENISNYEQYNGKWSLDGSSYEAVLENGGAILTCDIAKEGAFTGRLFTQQGISERFAEIEIVGKVADNKLVYNFIDDGWEGSGTLHIQFSEESISAWVENYKIADTNTSGYGINGEYEFIRCEENQTDVNSTQTNIMNQKNQYYIASSYHEDVIHYWEKVRGVTDISNVMEPLYETDKQYYIAEDFQNDPEYIIHLAKNEIYARHGYVFKDEDLYNYFMGCMWYEPVNTNESFDDSVFNDYEKENLKILTELDTYNF